MDPSDLPATTTVLVVGGGPVGLLTAIMLRRLGVPAVVVERRSEVQQAPAAHVVNARTFEIMRAAGVDMVRVDDACRPAADAGVRWVTSLTGLEIGHVPFERLDKISELDAITPTPLRNLSQHRLEPILRDAVPELGAGVSWVSATEHDGSITSVLRVEATGEQHEVTSRYLVAADGARSDVRRWLGIEMDGPQRLQAILAIHMEADLRHLVADRPATLYWLVDPAVPGTLIAHDIDRTWVLMQPWDPDTERLEDYTDERCTAMFARAVGTEVAGAVVRTVTPWNLSCQVAVSYRAGNVFLVGDAAHRFPPTGGLGLNTGAVDAQNLAWKLAAVEHGWAAPAILDTYDTERRPIAQTNAQQSLANSFKLLDVYLAIDGDPAFAVSTDEGRATVAAAIDGQREHFDMIGLQLGFAYPADGGLTVDDGSPLVAPDDPVRDYLPTTRPGARLPHVWIDGRRSTLDLVELTGFTAIVTDASWSEVCTSVARELGAPLAVVEIEPGVLDHHGALLVRPDQHVGWRSSPSDDDDRAAAVRSALRRLTARS